MLAMYFDGKKSITINSPKVRFQMSNAKDFNKYPGAIKLERKVCKLQNMMPIKLKFRRAWKNDLTILLNQLVQASICNRRIIRISSMTPVLIFSDVKTLSL